MSINGVYHRVSLIPNANGMGFDYAVMWLDKILCLCPSQEYAEEIAKVLDFWQDRNK